MKDFPYLNRDISWLSFNYRVLQEAKDSRVPLLERLKFLAIYSNNLGEFFRVRIASNRNLIRIGKKTKKELSFNPKEIVIHAIEIVKEHMIEFTEIFDTQIIPELKKHGIHLLRRLELSEEQKRYIEDYFKDHLLPYVQPVLLMGGKINPFLANATIYLALDMRDKEDPDKTQYALMQVPSQFVPRFVVLPAPEGEHHVIMLDDIVRHNVSILFPGFEIKDAYSIKLTRDAELYIDDEYSGNLMEKIKKSLKKRNIGPASRMVHDRTMPKIMLDYLMDMFELSNIDLIPESRYHNNFDFFKFPDFGREDLKLRPLPPLPYLPLKGKAKLFKTIAKKDHLVMFPYHDYCPVVEMFEQAAVDPLVTHIKVVQYRVSSDSRIMDALKVAVENGKVVFVFIEIKARFDEEANLRWGATLEKAGIKVRYSFPGLKVHAKVAMIRRFEDESFKEYCYLSTGNFHEGTAKIYSDFGFFTADTRITEEVKRLFKFLEKLELPTEPFEHLLVGQFNLFDELNELIDAEIKQAEKGKKALIILKLNSIQDPKMVKKLYKASNAGVEIRLIIRGICSVVPGIPEYSENIRAISIVDRYLEHARVFYFFAGGEEKIYLSSADWMERNLHRRIETAFPIYHPKLKKQIMEIIDLQWHDNVKARIIDASSSNKYQRIKGQRKRIQSQLETYKYFNRLSPTKRE